MTQAMNYDTLLSLVVVTKYDYDDLRGMVYHDCELDDVDVDATLSTLNDEFLAELRGYLPQAEFGSSFYCENEEDTQWVYTAATTIGQRGTFWVPSCN
jgi:hypothetical protein